MKQTIIALMLLCFGISLAFAQITTFPWTEDFEGTFLPDGWTKIVQAGNDITQSNSKTTRTAAPIPPVSVPTAQARITTSTSSPLPLR